MILKELALDLDKIFQKELALEWDRVGLQIGNSKKQIKKIMVTLDIDDELIEEAISCNTDLIISHHPAVFEALGSITDSTPVGKRILRLIENAIAVYSAHTNYDIMDNGLNDIIALRLGLTDIEYLQALEKSLYKFIIFVPLGSQEAIRKAICGSGGGRLGDYSCCTFSTRGKGTFLPGKDAQPYIGKTGQLSVIDEIRMECIVEEKDLGGLVKAAIKAHPYEEPAYDIYRMENSIKKGGPGRIGRLEKPMPFNGYLGILKEKLEADDIGWLHRGIENTGNRIIEKVAVVAGSCNSLAGELEALDCDIVITGEVNYHNAIGVSESGKIIAMAGHGTIEKYVRDGFYDILAGLIESNKMDIEVIKSKLGHWIWRYDFGRR